MGFQGLASGASSLGRRDFRRLFCSLRAALWGLPLPGPMDEHKQRGPFVLQTQPAIGGRSTRKRKTSSLAIIGCRDGLICDGGHASTCQPSRFGTVSDWRKNVGRGGRIKLKRVGIESRCLTNPLGLNCGSHMGFSQHILFAGDPQQLSAIVRSSRPLAQQWLGKSMFSYMDGSTGSTCLRRPVAKWCSTSYASWAFH